ncbi:MAG: hypothetical protein AAF950_17370 [Pseudomonadota bacterium]
MADDLPARIDHRLGKQPPCFRPVEHVAENGQRPIGAARARRAIIVIPAGDIRRGDGIDRQGGEERQERALEIAIIGGERGRFPGRCRSFFIDPFR